MVKASVTCKVTGEKLPASQAVLGQMIRPGVLALVQKDMPDFSVDDHISKEALKHYQRQYVEQVLAAEKGHLSRLDHKVIKSLVEHDSFVRNVEEEIEEHLTIGQRMADRIASFGGSWSFIIIFFAVLLAWMGINSYFLLQKPFDPYPFILLNLALSCLAAIQAPIIMMSQNRKEEKDRLRSENDYQVNLKAELEIRHLHEKLDNLMQKQWQRLLEIQRVQVAMLEEKGRKEK